MKGRKKKIVRPLLSRIERARILAEFFSAIHTAERGRCATYALDTHGRDPRARDHFPQLTQRKQLDVARTTAHERYRHDDTRLIFALVIFPFDPASDVRCSSAARVF